MDGSKAVFIHALAFWAAQMRRQDYAPSVLSCVFDCRNRSANRSEEHTSELQSQSNVVCRLLLEKNNYARQIMFEPIDIDVRRDNPQTQFVKKLLRVALRIRRPKRPDLHALVADHRDRLNRARDA